jgi:hypothetical protein
MEMVLVPEIKFKEANEANRNSSEDSLKAEISKAVEAYEKERQLGISADNRQQLKERLLKGDVYDFRANENVIIETVQFKEKKITISNEQYFFSKEINGQVQRIPFTAKEVEYMKNAIGIQSKHPLLNGGYFMDEKGKIHESCLENTAKENYIHEIKNIEIKHGFIFSKEEIKKLYKEQIILIDKGSFKGIFITNGNEVKLATELTNEKIVFNDKIAFNTIQGTGTTIKAANFNTGLDMLYKETGVILNASEKQTLLKKGTLSFTRKKEGITGILSINKDGQVVPLSVKKGKDLLIGNKKLTLPSPSTLYHSKAFGLMDVANCKDKNFLKSLIDDKSLLSSRTPVMKASIISAKLVLSAVKALVQESER